MTDIFAFAQKPIPIASEQIQEQDQHQSEFIKQYNEDKPKLNPYKEKMKKIEEDKPYTLCFTNCAPELKKNTLEKLIKFKLQIPYYYKKQNQYMQVQLNGNVEAVNITDQEYNETDIIKCIYFKGDNYSEYNQEEYKYKEKVSPDLYKTKIAFAVFKEQVTDDLAEKLRTIQTKTRTLFCHQDLRDVVNRQKSLFISGIRNNTDLQQIVEHVSKILKHTQPSNQITNLKTFHKDMQIYGHCYLEFATQLNEQASKRLYNTSINCPTPIKILKCVSEKKAQKQVEKHQIHKHYEKMQHHKGMINTRGKQQMQKRQESFASKKPR